MAKRKRSPMPEDIDLEEWEELVADKAAEIRYDESFLRLCDWFISADAAADVIEEQFTRVLTPQERKVVNNVLHWLAFVGYCLQEPSEYYKADADDFVEANIWDDKTTPKQITEPLLRLTHGMINALLDLHSKSADSDFRFW